MRFVDTSFWVAYFLRRDRHHPDALALWEQRPGPLLSTNHVIGETWTFMRRRDGYANAQKARRMIERSESVEIVHVDEGVEQEAWQWLDRHGEREYSFVDSTSFATMRRRGLLEALTFDGDFAAAGFVALRR